MDDEPAPHSSVLHTSMKELSRFMCDPAAVYVDFIVRQIRLQGKVYVSISVKVRGTRDEEAYLNFSERLLWNCGGSSLFQIVSVPSGIKRFRQEFHKRKSPALNQVSVKEQWSFKKVSFLISLAQRIWQPELCSEIDKSVQCVTLKYHYAQKDSFGYNK